MKLIVDERDNMSMVHFFPKKNVHGPFKMIFFLQEID